MYIVGWFKIIYIDGIPASMCVGLMVKYMRLGKKKMQDLECGFMTAVAEGVCKRAGRAYRDSGVGWELRYTGLWIIVETLVP